MKKVYESPVMIFDEYVAEQYVAAGDCGIHVGVPAHGHFSNSRGETHCAFTSTNCGGAARTCEPADGTVCNSFNTNKHFVVTNENGDKLGQPNPSYHNCHILSSSAAAQAFVDGYDDTHCAAGVATLMGIEGGGFKEIEQAFS